MTPPVAVWLDPAPVTDPIVVTDPIPVDLPVGESTFSPDGGLASPDGIQLDGWYQVLRDGSFLASGWSTDGKDTPYLIDYGMDGSVNTAFGNNGELAGPAGATYLWASQNTNGTIQVQGSVDNGDGTYGSFLEQFTSAGQLDTNFGGGTGSLSAPAGLSFDGDFQTLGNGDILAGATTTDGKDTPYLVDYGADGSVNTAFGNNGELAGPAGATYLWASQNANGTIQVQGSVDNGDGTYGSFLEQFTSAGQLDTNFGGGTGSLSAPAGLSFDGDFQTLGNGDILAGATTTDGNYSPVVVDYTSSGVLNTAFGTDGEIVAPQGVTWEDFYQDETTGDLVIDDWVYGTDGSMTLTSTSYTIDGQIDPASPATVVTAVDFFEMPYVMYDKSGGIDQVTDYQSGVETASTDGSSSSLATDGTWGPDSLTISLPESTGDISSNGVTFASDAAVSGSDDLKQQDTTGTSASSGIADISALKLAAAASGAVRVSSDNTDTQSVACSDPSAGFQPALPKDSVSLSRKAAKTVEPESVPDASVAVQTPSEAELVSALLAEA